ncbi:helix-turn-helix domain-containing protein [Lactococcus cremoris]|uniref:helix-turn-helix domain-containing protein n=1 Tax=Lactococcus lactis subsp. cremoris TaxID=1359 RepID=UPI0021821F72|nr:helix-turn-helix domain-containing protein [Lactococcus cremoris]MCT0503877.1 XRE family transcriptional regulator [Lactococcus cremoris]MCT0504692.1 XRE family transcriptional regulator [Lactococcus cremoris]
MIGKKLKAYRLMLDLTGTTLAKLAGINQPYLSEIENEKKVPPFDTFMNLVTAISKISPLNEENRSSILTNDNLNKFLGTAIIKAHEIPNYPDKVSIRVMFEGISSELGWIFNKDYDDSRYEPMEPFKEGKEIDSSPFKYKVLDELIYFFHNTLDDNPIYDNIKNLSESVLYDLDETSLYDFPFIRQSLFEWWYNQILTDITDNLMRGFSISEGAILMEVETLRNTNGTFTPTNLENTTNLSKELLDGKTVTFDFRSITDKNVRALLDGQLLTNDELTALKFTLNGIRYKRQNSNQNSYFGRKRQRLIDEGYFDNKD